MWILEINGQNISKEYLAIHPGCLGKTLYVLQWNKHYQKSDHSCKALQLHII